jgi:hypothetical protein
MVGLPTLNLGGLLDPVVQSLREQQQREQWGQIGDVLTSGKADYNQAAASMFRSGQPSLALKLLELGQAYRKQQLGEQAGADFSNAIGSMFGGGVTSLPPRAAANGVHVAENEADVQRLERATGMHLDPADLDRVVRTVYGEAAREPSVGQQAVAGVIANRASQSGMTPADVVRAPGQFEPWSDPAARARMEALDPTSPEYRRIASAVAPVMRGEVPDPTGGATHFYAPRAQAALGRRAPSWDDGSGQDIGGHRFFRHGYIPGATARILPSTFDAGSGVGGVRGGASPPGQAAAEMPAPGAMPVQAQFVVPGTATAVQPDSAVLEQRAQRAIEVANKGGLSTRINALTRVLSNPHLPDSQRQVGLTFLREAIDQAKIPDAAKEFLWARGNGLTQARTPAEYAREKAGPPTAVQEFEYAERNPAFAARQLELKRAGAQNINVGGGSDRQIFDVMGESATSARAAATGLGALREARAAVDAGIVSGAGADFNLTMRRVAAALGADASKVVNTETFRSAIAPQIAAMVKATVGSTQISNADREFAEKAAGGSITLNEGSIRRLLDIMERANVGLIETHQKRLNAVYPESGNFGRERALFGVDAPARAPAGGGAPLPVGGSRNINGIKIERVQ